MVVTHRPSLLKLVDRVIVIDAGKVVADGPKAAVMAALSNANRPGGDNQASPADQAETSSHPAPRPRPPAGMHIQRTRPAAQEAQ